VGAAVTAVLVVFIQAEQCDCVIFTNYDILLFVRKGEVYRGGVVYACEGKIVEGYFVLLAGWEIFSISKRWGLWLLFLSWQYLCYYS